MAKILITGANGQLGSEINAIAPTLPLHDFFFTDVEDLDITNYEAIDSFISQNKINFVVNCAAYTAVDKAETEQEVAEKINALAPLLIAKACKKNSCKFIHISTDYVFDGTASTPITEDVATNPQSIYGQTKLKGEELIINELKDSIVIRTSWLYSTFGNNFVKTMIRLGSERDALNVVADQKGTPTYARDLAKDILHIIDKSSESAKNFVSGIYHYSNLGETTWCDFTKEIHALSGITCNVSPIPTSEYPTPAKRPLYSVLDKTKIQKTFGISIPKWQNSLKDCIEKLKIGE